MSKFKIGDRVQVTRVEEGDDSDVGQVGTVLEESLVPWVCFDTPTRYAGEVSLAGAKEGYCDCLGEVQLQLLRSPVPAPTPEPFDLVGFVMAYAEGGMDREQMVAGFQHLIDTGMIWHLQDGYGRAAVRLIATGQCTPAADAAQ